MVGQNHWASWVHDPLMVGQNHWASQVNDPLMVGQNHWAPRVAGSVVKTPCATQKMQFQSLSQEDPLE